MVLGVSNSLSALTITPTTKVQWQGKDPGNPDENSIGTIVGSSLTFEKLYKHDYGEGEDADALFWDSYETTYTTDGDSGPEDATVTYVPGKSFISGWHTYLVVKDGQGKTVDPWWYVFDLLNVEYIKDDGTIGIIAWDGKEDIILEGFWPDQGALSHVDIYGVAVPEPATLFFLGLSFVGIAVAHRRYRK